MTKNITLAVDESVLEQVKVYAAERKTSVNALVRDYLDQLAKSADRTERARRRLLDLARESKAEVGPVTWKRGDLYDR
jgi:signal transduction histidine kinase